MRSESSPSENEILASFWDHLEDLRKLLVSCFFIVLTGTFLCFFFADSLVSLMQSSLPKEFRQAGPITTFALEAERILNTSSSPLEYTLPEGAFVRGLSPGVERSSEQTYRLHPGGYIDLEKIKAASAIVLLSPLEGFASALKVSLWTSLFLTSPFCIYLILRYIGPALRKEEKKLAIPLAISSVILMGAGISMALLLTLPLANRYFYQFNQAFGLNFWDLSQYLNYTLILLLAHGIAFQSGSLLFLLIHFQFVTSDYLAAKRSYAVVAILVFSALLTPPDVISQLMMAIPMLAFYELAILYGRMRYKRERIISPEHG